ncbi:hypothetical protein CDAR_452761 [Caerostris darwini]|uniref:Uncharacterized protein n=1 Tax=Caerostris darwini TaxID=1538125 RepID=A0AAV4SLZ6_9ARAC|nr:hypothetical protein CDAR_452761 [Caerostris darwini]
MQTNINLNESQYTIEIYKEKERRLNAEAKRKELFFVDLPPEVKSLPIPEENGDNLTPIRSPPLNPDRRMISASNRRDPHIPSSAAIRDQHIAAASGNRDLNIAGSVAHRDPHIIVATGGRDPRILITSLNRDGHIPLAPGSIDPYAVGIIRGAVDPVGGAVVPVGGEGGGAVGGAASAVGGGVVPVGGSIGSDQYLDPSELSEEALRDIPLRYHPSSCNCRGCRQKRYEDSLVAMDAQVVLQNSLMQSALSDTAGVVCVIL